jgi:hypothetical protein
MARGTTYLRIPERVWGHGLNNVLQETYVPRVYPNNLIEVMMIEYY